MKRYRLFNLHQTLVYNKTHKFNKYRNQNRVQFPYKYTKVKLTLNQTKKIKILLNKLLMKIRPNKHKNPQIINHLKQAAKKVKLANRIFNKLLVKIKMEKIYIVMLDR